MSNQNESPRDNVRDLFNELAREGKIPSKSNPMPTATKTGHTAYPTQKGVAYRVTYPKGRQLTYVKEVVGSMLLPNGFHAQKCEDTIRRRFRTANAFRAYGQDGSVFFCGSL